MNGFAARMREARFVRVSSARPRATPRTHRGSMMVELVVVITVGAILMGIGVTTIHLLLNCEHEEINSARHAASVSRLARIFREDIHAARDIDLPPAKPAVLIIKADDGLQIRYELDAHLATRVETRDETPTHRDVFYFPPHSELRFERDGRTALVRLEFALAVRTLGAGPQNKASQRPPARRLVIEAAPGRDHRFEPGRKEDDRT